MKVFRLHGRQPQKVAPLPDENGHRDSGGEANDHRRWDEADDRAHLRGSHEHQDDSGHERRGLQPGYAVVGRDPGKNGDKGSGRACDLNAAATQERDARATDDRRVDALLRPCPGGDGERHGQGQRDNADDHTGNDIGKPLPARKEPRTTGFEKGNHGGSILTGTHSGCQQSSGCKPAPHSGNYGFRY